MIVDLVLVAGAVAQRTVVVACGSVLGRFGCCLGLRLVVPADSVAVTRQGSLPGRRTGIDRSGEFGLMPWIPGLVRSLRGEIPGTVCLRLNSIDRRRRLCSNDRAEVFNCLYE